MANLPAGPFDVSARAARAFDLVREAYYNGVEEGRKDVALDVDKVEKVVESVCEALMKLPLGAVGELVSNNGKKTPPAVVVAMRTAVEAALGDGNAHVPPGGAPFANSEGGGSGHLSPGPMPSCSSEPRSRGEGVVACGDAIPFFKWGICVGPRRAAQRLRAI